MKKSRLLGVVCVTLSTFITMPVNAALLGRLPTTPGGIDYQAYYDDVANLTWLADANAGAGSVYNTFMPGSGYMDWYEATSWASSLNIEGITGWRLPDTLQPDTTCGEPVNGAYLGGDCRGSEMSNMFYNVLGGSHNISITTTHNANYDLFSNIKSAFYRSGTEYAPDTNSTYFYDMNAGSQSFAPKTHNMYAWAVHSGDVSAVPIPLIGVLPATPGGSDWQAYYDEQLDITWAADANINGGDSWYNQDAWAADLTIGGVSGWRLPSSDVNGDGIEIDCTGGGVVGCEDNEMGYLYWEEGITTSTPGPFINIQNGFYWSGTEFLTGFAFDFYFVDGSLFIRDMGDSIYAWAVHDGIVVTPIDSDNDGLPDIVEDGNGNGIVDAGETDPLNPDSDSDGALDGQEDINGNGVVDAGEADPLDPDSDGDGLTDGYEINVGGTDPTSTTALCANPGDMNDDGDVNAGDLLLLQRQILGL